MSFIMDADAVAHHSPEGGCNRNERRDSGRFDRLVRVRVVCGAWSNHMMTSPAFPLDFVMFQRFMARIEKIEVRTLVRTFQPLIQILINIRRTEPAPLRFTYGSVTI